VPYAPKAALAVGAYCSWLFLSGEGIQAPLTPRGAFFSASCFSFPCMRISFPMRLRDTCFPSAHTALGPSSLLRLGKEQYAPKAAPFVPCMRLFA